MAESSFKNSPSNIFAAVSKALGRPLDINDFNDRLLLQKGCFILNQWGYGPMFRFSLYIRGPYSSDLADEYFSNAFSSEGTTNVSENSISELSDIFRQGIGYTEAYATLMLVKNRNPNATDEDILKRTKAIKPTLIKEVDEAAACLL